MTQRHRRDEADFSKNLREYLTIAGHDAVQTETSRADGLCDINNTAPNGRMSWIELKQYNPDVPNLDHVSFKIQPDQAVFLCKRAQRNPKANAFVLGRVWADSYFIFPAYPDIQWISWVRKRIDLGVQHPFKFARLNRYEDIADCLADDMRKRFNIPHA